MFHPHNFVPIWIDRLHIALRQSHNLQQNRFSWIFELDATTADLRDQIASAYNQTLLGFTTQSLPNIAI